MRLLWPITYKTVLARQKGEVVSINILGSLHTLHSQDLEEQSIEQYSLISLLLPMFRKHSSPGRTGGKGIDGLHKAQGVCNNKTT